ncbi:TetR family transcriptional regulator C-terminal domain-containing protein [Roseovarius sp. SCSIO 43702]|uniref:TetR family transcriptional regulator C-terminal domain-containing protein n=1 Tax=Roseovarius sp. SCSIO 43702 TaxID=2823043 RepID=UPI001C72BC23|nr:TetR family transcriptional regulator C-terminal domain-containing protein [Roseovarius sp. SCSIO 43702]QYX57525.1 TetR family transcriptional regulator C-terminal domain-containing protein [Roseovarius sp. SCSIO 43702]
MADGTFDNRTALIQATLDAIADVGLTRTSVTEIIGRAGVSRGMIHLHFGGKGALITAAARQASLEYYANLARDLEAAGTTPARHIAAIVHSDLGPASLNPRSVAIWYELRGAARTDPAIAAYSDTRDKRLRSMIEDAFARIAPPETHGPLAREATIATISMVEGMWTDYLLHPADFDREFAARIVFRMLSSLMPHAFDLDGARAGQR